MTANGSIIQQSSPANSAMRILHISDLHFGRHDTYLKSDLVRRMEKLKPDLVVCTGDVADQPDPELLRDGLEYVKELGKCCASQTKPIIVVPGNHDYRESGWLGKASLPYKNAFTGIPTSGFFESESASVWVFGFNSAAEGALGGSGKVHPA